MAGETWTINSDSSLKAFLSHIDKLYREHKYITYASPRIGADRSLGQNALFHVWVTEYAAFKTGVHKRMISKGLLAGTKRIIKKHFTLDNPDSHSWMVFELINPVNGEKKKDYTSSADWRKGEMFTVLTWFQMRAAEDGLIMESKGEFAKLQREAQA